MPGIVTAVQDWASTISSRYHPVRKPSACRPQAPSVTCGDSSLPEGAMGFCLFTWACAYGEVPTVNPSVTAAPCQLPLAREPRAVPAANFGGESPLTISHDGFLQIVLSLTRPVSAACRRTYSLFTLHYSLNPPGIVTAEVVDAQTKAPLVKGGCLGTAEAGGFPRLAGFHIGLYFQEVPPVNPSDTPTACQLPLVREPLGGVSLACRRFLKYLPPLGSYGRFFRGYMGKFRKSVWVLAE